MEIIDQGVLDRLSEAARLAPRLRKNQNLHASDDARCHRLFNAIEPGSYVRPHRHLNPDKDEAFVMVRGSAGVITFDDEGEVLEAVRLSACGPTVAADVPHGVYHTVLGLEPGTVFFEAKAGPYLPLAPQEVAQWAPEEAAQEAKGYYDTLRRLIR